MAKEKVYIFWDNSNIFIPAKFVANRRDGPYAEMRLRIQFENLYHLATGGRDVGRAVAVGSIPPEMRRVWDRIEDLGVDIELYERGADSGTEQGVDQCLQVHMVRTLVDIQPPSVAVLLTGDGKGYDAGVGYHADLERLEKAGWGIEVLSWDAACRQALKDWATKVGVYVPLDDFYDSVTFIEGGRMSRPISLVKRRLATPKAPRVGAS